MQSNYLAPEATTDNLMDYNGGTTLNHWQWKDVHDPKRVWLKWTQDESGAESNIKNDYISNIQFYLSEDEISRMTFQLISSEPQMPDIRIKPKKTTDKGTEVKVRVKIEYTKIYNSVVIRQDSIFFPTGDWRTMQEGDIWDVDFGEEMHGGQLIAYCQRNGITETDTLYIRGCNPTDVQVKNYLASNNYSEWYLMKLIRHESGTHSKTEMLHFNAGAKYGDVVGCPNLGPPKGFGLMQLDHFDKEGKEVPTSNELWNWKANINRGAFS